MFSNSKNMNIFDQIIGKVVANEQFQMSKLIDMKPYIKELDDGSPDKKNAFFDIINKKFPNEINTFKNKLITDLGDKLNINSYLANINF